MDELITHLPGQWPLADASELRDELLAAYAAPTRGYHDTEHLGEVLARLDELARHDVTFDQVTVKLAAWFHDAVYDGRAGDEERSAIWAERSLAGLLTADLIAEVARLVRLTETHWPRAHDLNSGALCDADLAILAAPPLRYAEYTRTVRAEYSHVSDDDFRTGRVRILQDLAQKPHLFHTRYARDRWEHAARVNLEHELATLASPGTQRGDPQCNHPRIP